MIVISIPCFSQQPVPGNVNSDPAINTYTEMDDGSENKKALRQMIRDRNFPPGEGSFGRYEAEMMDYLNNSPKNLPASWTYVNSSGNLDGDVGRTSSITLDTINNGRFYICTPHSGVWITNDNGASYSLISDSLPTQTTSCLVIDPANTDVLYLATGAHNMDMPRNSMGVYKTDDGGVTWNATGLSFSPQQEIVIGEMIMNPQNTSSLLAATSDGLFRTYDSGNTWTKILTDGVYSVRFRPGDTTIIYTIGTVYYRSGNSGATFVAVSNGILDPYTWRYEYYVRTAAYNPDILYLVTSGAWNPNFISRMFVHKSTDSGLSFTVIDSMVAQVCGQFDVSQQTEDKYVMGFLDNFMRNGASSALQPISQWYGSTPYPYMHADQRGISFDPRNDSIIYFCNDGGLYRSTDNGNTFQNITSNMQLAHLYCISNSQDTNYKILVSPLDVSPYIIGTNGIDRTFSQLIESFSSHMSSINDSMYCMAHNSVILTKDDGATFYSSTSPLINNTSYQKNNFQYSDCDENVSFYASHKDIFKSTDYGVSYGFFVSTTYTDSNGFPWNPRGLAISRANHDYAYVYYADSVYGTTNGQNPLANITAGLPAGAAVISHMAVDPVNEKNVWISFSGYAVGEKVYFSSDAGQSWINVSAGLPNVPVNSLVCQPGVPGAIYAGTDGAVFYRDDTFSSWQLYNTGLPNVIITDLEIQQSLGKLRASTFGRGTWESDLHQTTPITFMLPPVARFTTSATHICPGETVMLYDNSCGIVDSVRWLFPGGIPSTASGSPGQVMYTLPGTYDITLIAYNAGGTDTVTRNEHIVADAAVPVPYYEPVGDLNAFVLPAGSYTTEVNFDNITWMRGWWVDGSSGPGDDFLAYDNFQVNLNGQEEKLVFPMFDFSGMSHPVLYFYRSYARRDAVTNDTLKVYARACGFNDSLVYNRGGAQLANQGGFYPSGYWLPAQPSDWVKDSVDLLPFAGHTGVTIAFSNKGQGGQLIYIDEFSISNSILSDVAERNMEKLISIYPNPATDMLYIRCENGMINSIQLTDPLGRIMLNQSPAGTSTATVDISSLSKGVYFIYVNGIAKRVQKF